MLAKLDALMSKASAIAPLPEGKQPYGGGPVWVESRPFWEWRAQALALLSSILPDDHTYVQQFASAVEMGNREKPDEGRIQAGLGILTAVREDIADGSLARLPALISGEIFSDFMEMAQHLHEEGYVHAAASIAGAVVEDALRRTLRNRHQRATGNLESMNQVALDKGIYERVVFMQVKVWIAIRNHADHGNWDAVEQSAVAAMIRDIPTFLAERLGLA